MKIIKETWYIKFHQRGEICVYRSREHPSLDKFAITKTFVAYERNYKQFQRMFFNFPAEDLSKKLKINFLDD